MDVSRFWALIDKARVDAKGDPEVQMGLLRVTLSSLTAEEIAEFSEIYETLRDRAYNWDVWGAAYIIGGGCSDDGFSDFRGWLVSRGQKVFEAALSNPETLAKTMKHYDGDGQIEGFQYLAFEAWEAVTGRTTDEFPFRLTPGMPKEPTGVQWDESEIYEKFPILAKKFE